MERVKQIAQSKLALYLSSKSFTNFEWSRHDCNTLVIGFHDLLHGTKYCDLLTDQYHDRKTAVKFIRGVMDNHSWFGMAKYTPTDLPPQDLDILSDGYRAWIVSQGWAWTVAEGHRLVKQPINTIKATTWRNRLWV